MARQLSTSLSDFVLAVSVFYVAWSWMDKHHVYGAAGILVQGLAASVGVVRFAMRRPEGTIVFRTHKFFSWLAAVFGLALIAHEFCQAYHADVMKFIVLIFAGCVMVTTPFQPKESKENLSQSVSGLSVLTVLVISVVNGNWMGVMAALVYILSGAIIGADGDLLGLKRVDLLHYALVVGNLLFVRAL